jgi:hypothetical protein
LRCDFVGSSKETLERYNEQNVVLLKEGFANGIPPQNGGVDPIDGIIRIWLGGLLTTDR